MVSVSFLSTLLCLSSSVIVVWFAPQAAKKEERRIDLPKVECAANVNDANETRESFEGTKICRLGHGGDKKVAAKALAESAVMRKYCLSLRYWKALASSEGLFGQAYSLYTAIHSWLVASETKCRIDPHTGRVSCVDTTVCEAGKAESYRQCQKVTTRTYDCKPCEGGLRANCCDLEGEVKSMFEDDDVVFKGCSAKEKLYVSQQTTGCEFDGVSLKCASGGKCEAGDPEVKMTQDEYRCNAVQCGTQCNHSWGMRSNCCAACLEHACAKGQSQAVWCAGCSLTSLPKVYRLQHLVTPTTQQLKTAVVLAAVVAAVVLTVRQLRREHLANQAKGVHW